jgi:uncharacterized protein (TIGR03382 family)
VLRPDVPYNQMDGQFGTTMGSEPSYNLSDYLMTTYKNDRQVTLLTGDPLGVGGASDVWMSGYLDGACDIILGPGGAQKAGNCHSGKISYLGGHDYGSAVPVTSGSETQGTRMFLNALFEADCVTAEGQPSFALSLTPDMATGAAFPVTTTFTVGFANGTAGFAYDGTLQLNLPAGVSAATTPMWTYSAIGGSPGLAGDPAASAMENVDLSFASGGDYPIEVELQYRVGTSTLTTKQTFTIHAGIDSDGDGVSDDVDPDPNDPNVCGDADGDGCDDCDASCMPGDGEPGSKSGGCCDTGGTGGGPFALAFVVVVLLARRRRMR